MDVEGCRGPPGPASLDSEAGLVMTMLGSVVLPS
jgi:hypothetical protein